MIIFEQNESFVMVAQHDHALVSWEMAQNWKDDYFPALEKKQDVLIAVREHDRGWIDLDAKPLWDDINQRPYSFMNYPVVPKIASYKKGIDEVCQMNKYAGLLCSLHFASFIDFTNEPEFTHFWNEEKIRQGKLIRELDVEESGDKEKNMFYHLDILKFCDNLSLYICLNEPKVQKPNEHPFYRNGFPQIFPFANNKRIFASWTDEDIVSLSISPLKGSMEVSLPIKIVTKEMIRNSGLSQAYTNTPFEIRRVTYV